MKINRYLRLGKKTATNHYHKLAIEREVQELEKAPKRTDIINYLLSLSKSETSYLEIGVRNPNDNFNHINSKMKYSVDPGLEFEENPVNFKMTSDDFFKQLKIGEILSKEVLFDVIFIDGLHLAEQVDLDIQNALNYLKEDGFIVLHDCNPPTQWHAREQYNYHLSPARKAWNGTTWKAFMKWRFQSSVYSCCIDCDWGVGILSKSKNIGKSIKSRNPFFEFNSFEKNREENLNLMSLAELKKVLNN